MTFQNVLSRLVEDVDGAIGAMFLDWEGESVDLYGWPDRHDMRLLGAYQGIFLNQLRRFSDEMELGDVTYFKIAFRGAQFFNAVLEDGYYLSLATEPQIVEGVAWQAMRRARRLLNEEIV